MKTMQTALAVGLAVIVVAVFFVFPGLNPFNSIGKAAQAQQSTVDNVNPQPSTGTTATDTSTPSPTMTMSDGLQITDEIVGTGATAEPGDTVTVNYVGSLTNGTIFDASANHGNSGFTFTLGRAQVIKGWDEGIVGMKVGGKRKLVIPPALAYGSQAVGGVIPADSTLVFEVELLSVQTPSGQ